MFPVVFKAVVLTIIPLGNAIGAGSLFPLRFIIYYIEISANNPVRPKPSHEVSVIQGSKTPVSQEQIVQDF